MPKAAQNPTRALKEAKYSFDSVNSVWYCGKKPTAEEDVLIFLIQFAKARNIPNAGEYAADALAKAKTDPEITTRAFMRARMVRNRNRRTAKQPQTPRRETNTEAYEHIVSGEACPTDCILQPSVMMQAYCCFCYYSSRLCTSSTP